MEGPSLFLLTEQMKPFLKKKVLEANGTAPLAFDVLSKGTLKKALSWGKHLILVFEGEILRVHFLMFGSYRINETRDREPKLNLVFPNGFIHFYSCSIKPITKEDLAAYDWSIDLMSEDWDEKIVLKKARKHPETMVCDLLMDQTIFPGLGNIIKNEILFKHRLHPEALFGDIGTKKQLELVRETRAYSVQFYEWKKIDQLKRNWKIFRKRVCPLCKSKLTIAKTGTGERVSYYCSHCQPLPA